MHSKFSLFPYLIPKKMSKNITKFKYLVLIISLFLIGSNSSYSERSNYRIGNIFFESKDVFDSTQNDWFWGAKVLNKLHTITQPFIIEDELLFSSDDDLNLDVIDETERNLRRTGLFTKVLIEIDSVNPTTYDVIVNTQDRWSLQPAVLYGTGGGVSNYGGKLQESNLFGTWTNVSLEMLYRTENKIGLQGLFELNKQRLFRSDLTLNTVISSNKFRSYQKIDIFKPYWTLNTEDSYGLNLFNQSGNDFLYLSLLDTTQLIKVKEQKAAAYYSKVFFGNDRAFMTFYTSFHNVDRGDKKYRRAFDNSGQFFAVFSSVSEEYIKTTKLNTYLDEDLQVGGYGSAILGRTFSLGNGGETLWYIAADGETSYYTGDFYVNLRAAAGSAFFSNQSKYVSQESEGLAFYNVTDNILITSKIQQQTVWRWDAMRQLILDTDSGLRGFDVNRLSGDNRLFSNTEIRYFPNMEFWALNFSGVAFFDIGTVWNQSSNIAQAKFYKTGGLGLRIHNMKMTGKGHILRLDFAYNISEGKFGGIVFGTEQYFSAFKWHLFKLPKIIGLDFDQE